MTTLAVNIKFLFANSQNEAKPKLFKDWVFPVTFDGKRLDPPPCKGMISLAQIISFHAEISASVVCLMKNVRLNNLNNPFYTTV